MNKLREGLPELPQHMRHLPVSEKGYPIPWFVQKLPDGTYDFRVMDASKLIMAHKFRRCWVCGGTLGRYMTFVVGPMCVVNRTSAEPPSHYECAKFSAVACPFLTLPKAQRREANMPDVAKEMAGVMIPRNPGVTCLWTVRSYKAFNTERGPLFNIGKAETVEWFAEKKHATTEQIMYSINTGMPILREMAAADGPRHVESLEKAYAEALDFVPPAGVVVSP